MKYFNVILVILLVLLQYRLWYGSGSLPDLRALEEIKAEKITENDELLERNLVLTAEVIDLKEGLDAIEERARSEMGMVQSGETFFQIIDQSSLNTNN
ncbi:MAG: cell division protein FtsB [Gammaproteobacteria bacterium]|nr:cell division protein FtsB [Gammaproteobacteria bacterium]